MAATGRGQHKSTRLGASQHPFDSAIDSRRHSRRMTRHGRFQHGALIALTGGLCVDNNPFRELTGTNPRVMSPPDPPSRHITSRHVTETDVTSGDRRRRADVSTKGRSVQHQARKRTIKTRHATTSATCKFPARYAIFPSSHII